MPEQLSRENILRALSALDEELRARNVRGELCLFGGAVMVLAFRTRPSTRDVDAIFQPSALIREAAQIVRHELDLPDHWLNDGVKGFVSARGELTQDDLPQFANLHITRPTAAYLLAMKALAARAQDASGEGDRDDVRALILHEKLRAPEAVFALIERFYPSGRILPKTEYLVREIFDEHPPAESA